MAKHGFGIMDEEPTKEQNFIHYEPEKYRYVEVNDIYIEPILPDLKIMQCFWHSLNRRELGLCYCGITLIPPESLEVFLSAIIGRAHTEDLASLLLEAQREKKFVIHFGI